MARSLDWLLSQFFVFVRLVLAIAVIVSCERGPDHRVGGPGHSRWRVDAATPDAPFASLSGGVPTGDGGAVEVIWRRSTVDAAGRLTAIRRGADGVVLWERPIETVPRSRVSLAVGASGATFIASGVKTPASFSLQRLDIAGRRSWRREPAVSAGWSVLDEWQLARRGVAVRPAMDGTVVAAAVFYRVWPRRALFLAGSFCRGARPPGPDTPCSAFASMRVDERGHISHSHLVPLPMVVAARAEGVAILRGGDSLVLAESGGSDVGHIRMLRLSGTSGGVEWTLSDRSIGIRPPPAQDVLSIRSAVCRTHDDRCLFAGNIRECRSGLGPNGGRLCFDVPVLIIVDADERRFDLVSRGRIAAERIEAAAWWRDGILLAGRNADRGGFSGGMLLWYRDPLHVYMSPQSPSWKVDVVSLGLTGLHSVAVGRDGDVLCSGGALGDPAEASVLLGGRRGR